MKLFQNPDGASAQARAVLAYLTEHDGIEESWDEGKGEYLAYPEVDRWHNCREQGYVVYLRSKDYTRQLNIAFFEHANSDDICAFKWEKQTQIGNPPTLLDLPNFNVAHEVTVGKASEMADWIYAELGRFWVESSKTV